MRQYNPTSKAKRWRRLAVAGILLSWTATLGRAQTDPGVRGGGGGAGAPLPGLSANEMKFFDAGLDAFNEANDVKGTITGDGGLGPTFNLDSCGGCHVHPAIGGTSPAINPQIAMATKAGANQRIPSFLRLRGPIREARFKFVDPTDHRKVPDGGVHGLFTIAGRSDAGGCTLAQPNFAFHVDHNNVIFRIPTPLFGTGLIEAISEATLEAADRASKPFGISGKANRNGNDGTITRFGWKAQNKSLLIFSAEAYNVEQGVTNEGFPDERQMAAAAAANCLFNVTPEDRTDVDSDEPSETSSDVVAFANFMRFLAPPTPVASFSGASAGSISNGSALFNSVGCAACHTPSYRTGNHSSAVLANKVANLYSDLLVHDMGTKLADSVNQGLAEGDEFRTAPLWGLGQRIFFLHDGRTDDLVEAILEHSSSGSEANTVIERYKDLSRNQKQDLLNFLRSL